MFNSLKQRAQRAGLPPGTPVYTGEKPNVDIQVTVLNYNVKHCQKSFYKNPTIGDLPEKSADGVTWVNIEGLHDTQFITALAERYKLHPLTIEDILTVDQRPKVETFEHYNYLTYRALLWQPETDAFSIESISLIFGKNFVLSFHESGGNIFGTIYDRFSTTAPQRLREHGSDYLAYRLLDITVDNYFVILELLGDRLQVIEEQIIDTMSNESSKQLYQIKREVLSLRKAIWPMREVVSHLLQSEDKLITQFTRVYLRDVYDHSVQAVETLEIFRDMLSGLLDVYLSSLSNRMNEIMKILTMISTIFIPITFVTGFFGMNFVYIPGVSSHGGYLVALTVMASIVVGMLVFFKRKRWI